jgi:NAD(P)H-nitrite reductase large subunit
MVKYLIIRNGVAGTTAADNIRKLNPGGKTTIISEEDIPFYYRIRLGEYIVGEITEQALVIKKWRISDKKRYVLIRIRFYQTVSREGPTTFIQSYVFQTAKHITFRHRRN